MEGTGSSVKPKPVPMLRERLIAGLLMHECCMSVTGGWSVANPKLEDFVNGVVCKVFGAGSSGERKSLLLKGLYPLNEVQITRRFGVCFQDEEDGVLFDELPSFEECQRAFVRATKENSVLRACGVKLNHFTHPSSGMSATFIPLEGLENYLAA